jgi:serine/threonine-protein phosphatase 2A regulatory subunit A
MSAVDPKNTLYPITVLIDELKSDDKKKRINSVKNLPTISVALGMERTRNELMPYIMDLMDDDEEILVALAETLNGQFLEYVGGPLFAPHLFKPLERLCEVEETVVRDKVSSLIIPNLVVNATGSRINKTHFLPCEHQRFETTNHSNDRKTYEWRDIHIKACSY